MTAKERVDALLINAFHSRASDLHLTVGARPTVRINGTLRRLDHPTLAPNDTEEIAMAIIPDNLRQAFSDRGEIDFSYSIQGVSRFRVNIYRQRSCCALAFRIVPTEVPSLEDLGMPEILKKIAERPQGLVLVTGPTGSGKSTTLAAMINYMNETMNRHIITLEDPIEYLHKHRGCLIDQREVGLDTKSFSGALRAAMRQDPDVILVGEMRDLETIATAITAAETGHLVLATLHTSTAPSTIDRIIDVFPAAQQSQIRIQLASELAAIISQRLFPTADGNGRVAALEILVNNPAIANLIRSEKIHQIMSIMQTSRAQGMCTLEMSINQLLQERKITAKSAQSFLRRGSA